MSEFVDRVVWLLIFLRDQCMPVTIGNDPGVLDYTLVGVAAAALVVGTVCFARGLVGKDTEFETRLKAQVLED